MSKFNSCLRSGWVSFGDDLNTVAEVTHLFGMDATKLPYHNWFNKPNAKDEIVCLLSEDGGNGWRNVREFGPQCDKCGWNEVLSFGEFNRDSKKTVKRIEDELARPRMRHVFWREVREGVQWYKFYGTFLIDTGATRATVGSDNPRVVYETSRLLSSYIREKVTKGGRSVWIAHRGGRTKNGRDSTEQGLLKMLDMSGTGSFYENFSQLKLMPVTISYEYETCGALKALEMYKKEQQGFYRKQPGEDINSMMQGFMQRKGRVHVDFAQPLTAEELLKADGAQRNEKFRILANTLDSRLRTSYRLWPANYAAADILLGSKEFFEGGFYTLADKESLIDRLRRESEGMPDEIYTRMLHIYAAHII